MSVRESTTTPAKISLIDRIPPGLEEIEVAPDQVAAGVWEDLVRQTAESGSERGVLISEAGRALRVSRVFGLPQGGTYNPFFLSRLSPLRSREREIALVRTHDLGPELAHIQTSTFTDSEVRYLNNSDINALVALDRAGAHMLIKDHLHSPDISLPGNVVQRIFDQIVQEGLTSVDFAKRVGSILRSFGLLYYYSSGIAKPEDQPVRFTDIRAASFS